MRVINVIAEPLPGCSGPCNQGRKACTCSLRMPRHAGVRDDVGYENEINPKLSRFIDRHPTASAVAAVWFVLAVLMLGGFIDGGAL